MKYKLLTEKGVHFVCLEDGTKIPLQIKTRIEQTLKDEAFATVTAYADERMLGGLRAIKNDVAELYLGEKKLTDLRFVYIAEGATSEDMTTVGFSCYVELVDTVEQPKPRLHE